MKEDKELFIKENLYQIKVGSYNGNIILFFIFPEIFYSNKKYTINEIRVLKKAFKNFNITYFLTDEYAWVFKDFIIKTWKI